MTISRSVKHAGDGVEDAEQLAGDGDDGNAVDTHPDPHGGDVGFRFGLQCGEVGLGGELVPIGGAAWRIPSTMARAWPALKPASRRRFAARMESKSVEVMAFVPARRRAVRWQGIRYGGIAPACRGRPSRKGRKGAST